MVISITFPPFRFLLDLNGGGGERHRGRYRWPGNTKAPGRRGAIRVQVVEEAPAPKPIQNGKALEQAKQGISPQEPAEQEEQAPAQPAPRRKAKVSPFVLHPEIPAADRHEYRITDDAIGVGTPGERFNNNIRAIRLLKKLEQEDRFATRSEQAVLAQYVGWGGLADCFDERHSKYAELKTLLTEDEYAAAR